MLPSKAGRVGRSWATGRVDAHGLGKRRPCAAGLGEALQNLLPAPLVSDLERDAAVEINPLKRNVRRAALRPPRIGLVLLWCIRESACPQQEEGEYEGRSYTSEEPAALVGHRLLYDLVRPQKWCLRDRQAQGLGSLEVDDKSESVSLLYRKISRPCTFQDSAN